MAAVSLADVEATAGRMGLEATLRSGARALLAVMVEREADDWSLSPLTIAIGPDLPSVSLHAIEGLRKLAPQIERRIAGLDQDESESETVIRLHPDDIAALADAIAERLR